MERWYDFSGMLLFLTMVIPAAQDLTRYPILQPDVQAHYLSSFDRTGGNDDGFDDMEKIGEIDVDGPIELTSQFEGRDDDVDVTDRGRAVSERSRFAFDVPPGYARLRLRRLFDQSSRQEAEVWVGGTNVGVWYTATTNAHKRWAEADYLLPASLTAGKERLEVEFRVLGPGWNEFRYELWGIR